MAPATMTARNEPVSTVSVHLMVRTIWGVYIADIFSRSWFGRLGPVREAFGTCDLSFPLCDF